MLQLVEVTDIAHYRVLTSEKSWRTDASECYLLPSWWCHPCAMALLPTGCYPEGNLALAECSPVPSFGSHQTSRTHRRWTGRFCHCVPRWRQLPPCPRAAHFSLSCPSQRGVEDNRSWPRCLWRPNTETLEEGGGCDDILKNCINETAPLCAVISSTRGLTKQLFVYLLFRISHIQFYVHSLSTQKLFRMSHWLTGYLCLGEISDSFCL